MISLPSNELTPLVYTELRNVAAAYLRRERPDHTLQATALVNEAYLRLIGQKPGPIGKTASTSMASPLD